MRAWATTRGVAAACLMLNGCTPAELPQQSVQALELPACTQPRVMAARTYLVFFGPHSAVLVARPSLVIKDFARMYQGEHGNYIILQGNTDMAETAKRDRTLGRRRAEAVADRLAQLGIARDTIVARDMGASRPLVPTPPGVSEPQNRRVEFYFGSSGSDAERKNRRDCFTWLSKTYCDAPSASGSSIFCHMALQYLEDGRGS